MTKPSRNRTGWKPVLRTSNNRVSQCAKPFDRQFDKVPRLQPPADGFRGQFEDASTADRPGAEHVAGSQFGVAACVREELWPRPVHVPRVAARIDSPIDAGSHFQLQPAIAIAVSELRERDELRTERRRKILALTRPEADGHFGSLQIAGAPVIHDREPGD